MMEINLTRLKEKFAVSNQIGTGKAGGLTRLALSNEDRLIRNELVDWMKALNLEVRIDDFGNVYGRREGNADLPPFVIGSHLDTQPEGGKFDGILGVLASLEVINTLNDYDYQTEFPIEVVNFTNEEGARFEPALLGSGGLTGVFDKEYVYSRRDKHDKTFLEELKRTGYLGDKSNRLTEGCAYVELHIEQGPILENLDKSIGIVEGILGISWVSVKVTGKSGHAGPTPMHLREDAVEKATKVIQKVYEVANEFEGLLLTIGKVNVNPNVVNSIAEEVLFTVDVRHKDDETRLNFIKKIKKLIKGELVVDWDAPAINFSQEIQEVIQSATEKNGLEYEYLYSGAGHDAMYMNKIMPTGMIFVPSIGGISHVEHELTLDKDIEKGAQTLLSTIISYNRNRKVKTNK